MNPYRDHHGASRKLGGHKFYEKKKKTWTKINKTQKNNKHKTQQTQKHKKKRRKKGKKCVFTRCSSFVIKKLPARDTCASVHRYVYYYRMFDSFTLFHLPSCQETNHVHPRLSTLAGPLNHAFLKENMGLRRTPFQLAFKSKFATPMSLYTNYQSEALGGWVEEEGD